MLYNPPTGSTDPNAPYVGKNTAAGTQGSKVPPAAVESTQREMVALIAAGQAMGLDAPTGTDLRQVLKAVRSGLLNRFLATGSPDAISIAPQPVYVGLIEGMRFRFKIPGTAGASNTSTTPMFAVNGLPPANILRRDGTAPAKGDLIAGRVAELEIDAAGAARIVGLVASDQAVTSAVVNPIIKNYLAALPPVQVVYVDAVNGSEAADGSTIALARKDIDAVLDGIGTTATQLFLLSDVTIKRRRNVYASLSIQGVAPSSGSAGYTPTYRNIAFLGTADNSPSPAVGTFSSGLFLLNTNLSFSYINCILPDAVPGQNYTAHITSNSGTNIIIGNFGVIVQSSNAGAVFGSTSTPIEVFGNVSFAPNAAGHLFEGIAAGGNPNTAYRYRSNITSA